MLEIRPGGKNVRCGTTPCPLPKPRSNAEGLNAFWTSYGDRCGVFLLLTFFFSIFFFFGTTQTSFTQLYSSNWLHVSLHHSATARLASHTTRGVCCWTHNSSDSKRLHVPNSGHSRTVLWLQQLKRNPMACDWIECLHIIWSHFCFRSGMFLV